MMRYFLKLMLSLLVITNITSCGDPSPRREHILPPELPVKGTKIAFIFPAGGGAMRTIFGVTEKMEKDLGLLKIGSIIDMAVGVSSGSQTAAALTYGDADKPKYSSRDIKPKLADLVKNVFPDINEFVDKLANEYEFSFADLEAIVADLAKKSPDLSSSAAAEKSCVDSMINASKKRPGIITKISDKGGMDDLKRSLNTAHVIDNIVATNLIRPTRLRDSMEKLVGNPTISVEESKKVIAISSTRERQAVFFGGPEVVKSFPGPYGVSNTLLLDALLASSAIPGFIKAPTIELDNPSNSPELVDGVLAAKFDPSKIVYDIFTKMFDKQDLLIIFVGNGGPIDVDFRIEHRIGRPGVSQKINENGSKVTFVAIDPRVVDDEGNNLFNISQFYVTSNLNKLMDKAAVEATKQPPYKWAIKAMKAIKN